MCTSIYIVPLILTNTAFNKTKRFFLYNEYKLIQQLPVINKWNVALRGEMA